MRTNVSRSSRGSALTVLAAVLLGPATLIGTAALAQDSGDNRIHWAYGAFLGSGVYSIDGNTKSYAFGFKPRKEFTEARLTDDGERRLGFALRVPFSIGTYSFDTEQLAQNVRLRNVSTVSVVPGVEVEIPVSPRWKLKPLVHVGWGTQTNDSSSAWIYAAGLKSELAFPETAVGLRLVTSLTYIGFSSRDESSSQSRNTLPLQTGLEFGLPLRDTRLGGDTVKIYWHVARTHYLNELRFDNPVDQLAPMDISDIWEVGVAFGKADSKLKVWKISLDRVGLAFRSEAGGDFKGISLTFNSLFDR